MVRSSIAIGADQPVVAINSMDGKATTGSPIPVPGFTSTLLEQDAEFGLFGLSGLSGSSGLFSLSRFFG
jgi:hypothetical protein